MRRRDFLVYVGGSLAGAPSLTYAQEPQQSSGEQVDRDLRWFLLNSEHPTFRDIYANLSAAWRFRTSGPLQIVKGRNPNETIIKTWMTERQKLDARPSLAIGAGAVLDEFNYNCSQNRNNGPKRLVTNRWGDSFPVWGVFLQPPERLPTFGEDRRIAHAMGKSNETICYVGQESFGTGDGSSYLNRRRIRDFLSIVPGGFVSDLRKFDIVVLCGSLSRFLNEGSQAGLTAGAGFLVKSGTAHARTQILSHPVDTARLTGGNKLGGSGAGEGQDWTDVGGGVWSIDCGRLHIYDSYIISDAGGRRRCLTKVASPAECRGVPDSSYVSASKVWVHLSDASNPRTTTYVPTNGGGVSLLTRNLQFADFYGIEFWQAAFGGSGHAYHSDIAFYGCLFKCGSGFSQLHTSMNPKTGQFVQSNSTEMSFASLKPWVRRNLIIHGCHFENYNTAIYDNTTATDATPTGTVFKDNYCHKLMVPAAENFGYSTLSHSDSHTIAVYGSMNGWTIENNCMDRCGNQNIVYYGVSAYWYSPDRKLSNGTFENGDFARDISGWTDVSTGAASIRWDKGKLVLRGAAAGVAKAVQSITIDATYIGNDSNGVPRWQVVRIETGRAVDLFNGENRIYVDVGTTPGGNDLFNGTTNYVSADQDGITAIWFEPKTTVFHVTLYNPNPGDVQIAKIVLLQDLMSEPGYLEGGFGRPASAHQVRPDLIARGAPFQEKKIYWTMARNFSIKHNWIRNPVVGAANSVGNGVGIDIGGDYELSGWNGRIQNIEIAYNRIEGTGAIELGNFDFAAVRTKAKTFIGNKHPNRVRHDTIHVHHNVIRGVCNGFVSNSSYTVDEDGTKVSPSYRFEHNDVHALAFYASVNEVGVSPTECIHKIEMRNNIYRVQYGARWIGAKTTTYSFFTWKSGQISGDTRDSIGSTHAPFKR